MYEVFPVFMPDKGVILNSPEEALTAQNSPYSRNMEYFNGLLQGRGGLTKFDQNALPNGPISNGIFFKIFTGTTFLVYGTKTDLAYYDFANLRHVFINRTYTTGTISIGEHDGGGNPVYDGAGNLINGTIVYGVGTAFTTNTKAGDYIKIGAGGIHSGSTWYQVLSVDSDTQLTLTTVALPCFNSAYVIRKTFTGGSTNIWSMKQWVDLNLGDCIVATNGVDSPVYWTGSNQAVVIPNSQSTTCKWFDIAFERLVWIAPTEGAANQPQRVRYSEPGDLTTYVAINFFDFLNENTWITGSCLFAGYFIIFKEREAYIGQPDVVPNIITYSKSATCRGAKAFFSIVQKNEWIYYYAYDKKFHRWDILRDQIISEEIFPDTKNFDTNLDQYIMGADFYPKNQIRWLCPLSSSSNNNYQVVYDYLHNVTETWDCANSGALSCFLNFLLTASLYCDDPIWGVYYVDGTQGFCDDVNFLSNAPSFLVGGYDGYLRQVDQGTDDDGMAYTRRFRSSRLNFGQPNRRKRLWKNEFWFQSTALSSVTIQLRRDDNVNFDSGVSTISLSDSTRDVVKIPITWNREAEDFQIDISSTSFFALLGFYNVYMMKRSTFK